MRQKLEAVLSKYIQARGSDVTFLETDWEAFIDIIRKDDDDYGAFRLLLSWIDNSESRFFGKLVSSDRDSDYDRKTPGYLIRNLIKRIGRDKVLTMIRANKYEAFHLIQRYFNPGSVVESYIIGFLTVEDEITLSQNYAFSTVDTRRWEAASGNPDGMNALIAKMSVEEIQKIIRKNNYTIFSISRPQFNWEKSTYLAKLIDNISDEDITSMMEAKRYDAFFYAAFHGHVGIIQRHISRCTRAQIQDMIHEDNFRAFRLAAGNGKLEVIDILRGLIPAADVQKMICAENYSAFRLAAHNGHLDVIDRLIELTSPTKFIEMITAEGYQEAFFEAAKNGHLAIMNRLIALQPKKALAMIRAKNYWAFVLAAGEGKANIITRLIDIIPPDELRAMIRAHDYRVINYAAKGEHLDVLESLFRIPEAFSYAVKHDLPSTAPFVTSFLGSLKKEPYAKQDGSFDITDVRQARQCLYIMRNLIRQNTPKSLDQLTFLLTIPAVQALAHQAITPGGPPNELLNLSVSSGNQQAERLLMRIHGVEQLRLITNPESSMSGLSPREQERLRKVTEAYRLEWEHGVEKIMGDLKIHIQQLYQQDCASVTTAQARVSLPLEFNDFEMLDLSTEDRKKALESYYKHPVHTAYRYLSKPNFWIDGAALYAVRTEASGPYSNFEDCQDLIALLYLAAKDTHTPAINGFTIETRILEFLRELAYIGRAHNWDSSRSNTATGHDEEYDDLEGDKPSCIRGQNKRLMLSVKGHPLLNILTEEIIDIELCKMMSAHFISRITEDNYVGLLDAWQKICDGASDKSSTESLNVFNLTQEEKDHYISMLSAQYGDELDRHLKAYLQQRLEVKTPFNNLAEQFGGETNLLNILGQKRDEFTKKPSSSRPGESSKLCK